MAWAGSVRTLPALLLSRLWFNSRMSSCQGDGPGAIPGSRTNSPEAERPVVCGRVEGATPFGSANLLDRSVPKVRTSHPTNIRPRPSSEA